MSEEMIMAAADAAEIVVDGFAIIPEASRIRIVHLHTGRVVVVDPIQGVIASSMQELEEVLALRHLEENRKFLVA